MSSDMKSAIKCNPSFTVLRPTFAPSIVGNAVDGQPTKLARDPLKCRQRGDEDVSMVIERGAQRSAILARGFTVPVMRLAFITARARRARSMAGRTRRKTIPDARDFAA